MEEKPELFTVQSFTQPWSPCLYLYSEFNRGHFSVMIYQVNVLCFLVTEKYNL